MLVLLFVMASCQAVKKPLTVLEVRDNDNETALTQHRSECSLQLKTLSDDQQGEPEKTIVVHQKTLTGRYKQTVVSPFYQDNKIFYSGLTDENLEFTFGLSTETNALVHLRYHVFRATGLSRPIYTEEEVLSAVEEKTNDIYSPSADTHTYTYQVTDVRLTRLEGGQMYLKYDIQVDLSPKTDGYQGCIDHTSLLIRVG